MATEFWIVAKVGVDEDAPVTSTKLVIKAGTKAQVRQHILAKYKITLASKEMLVDLLTAGCKWEDVNVTDEVAGDEPAGEGKP